MTSKFRTIIIAVATTVPDNLTFTQEELDTAVKAGDPDSTVVGVLDRDKPENNYEPQIFAAYEDSGAPDWLNWPVKIDSGSEMED